MKKAVEATQGEFAAIRTGRANASLLDHVVVEAYGTEMPLRHIANVQMIGILRLRYRPHTSMTAAWWQNLQTNAEKHLRRYAEIVRDFAKRAAI